VSAKAKGAAPIEILGRLGRREAEALALAIRALARREGVELDRVTLSVVTDEDEASG
jgi:hypothetical protein